MKNFTIVKRFGKYYDDVYNVEFFNESVTLAAKEQDSKVVSVLPGKVIYEKKNQSILDNVVIIQHPNGLHTVYSHLDKISPTISTGWYLMTAFTAIRVLLSTPLSFPSLKFLPITSVSIFVMKLANKGLQA